jgi:CheY-like chemotaxis protein
MVGQQAHGRGIKMVYAQMDTALCVLADRTRLKQVFVNLLSNAIKYNRASGSVFVDSVPTSPQWLRVSVRDTGLGLAAPQLARLFQPFNRLGREAGNEEGTGIGLVVTKRLIELMGGRMGVDSVVAQGSVFWFELELTAPAQLSAPSATEAGPVQLPTPKNALAHTLLYVEDNPANLELVRQLVERHADLRLLTAMDATVAIELARAHLPHVILMDINLPGISGIEAMQILRADPLTAHIPIIAVSASASNIDINKGLKAGFFSYVTKPIRVDKFMESINEALACSQASTGWV